VEVLQIIGLWLSGQQKRGKLPQNHRKSATELPEVRMLDVTENPLPIFTPQLLS
jgi:hypothetical protein